MNLKLFKSEYELAARMARGQGKLLNRLAHEITSMQADAQASPVWQVVGHSPAAFVRLTRKRSRRRW